MTSQLWLIFAGSMSDEYKCGEQLCKAAPGCLRLTLRRRKGKVCCMIVSVGVDMIEVERVKRAIEDAQIGRRFRDRVYTEKEIRYCERRRRGKYESYAGRFAAKEAVMKALGRGWGAKVSWLNIEIAPARGGRPEVTLHKETSALARELGIRRLSLSITHTESHALAYVIAQDE